MPCNQKYKSNIFPVKKYINVYVRGVFKTDIISYDYNSEALMPCNQK